jgi:hypothetical protein
MKAAFSRPFDKSCVYPQWSIGENGEPLIKREPFHLMGQLIDDPESPYEGNEDHPLFNLSFCKGLWEDREKIQSIVIHPSLRDALEISLPRYYYIWAPVTTFKYYFLPVDKWILDHGAYNVINPNGGDAIEVTISLNDFPIRVFKDS